MIQKTSTADAADDDNNDTTALKADEGCNRRESPVVVVLHAIGIRPSSAKGPCGGCRRISLPTLKDITRRRSPEREHILLYIMDGKVL